MACVMDRCEVVVKFAQDVVGSLGGEFFAEMKPVVPSGQFGGSSGR